MQNLNEPVQVSQILNNQNILTFKTSSREKPSETPSITQEQSEKLIQVTKPIIDQIFAKLSRIYQAKFWKDFHVEDQDAERRKQKIKNKLDACKAEWLDSDLRFYSEEEIGKALDRAKHEFDWPPTLKEFIALCEYASEYDSADKAYNNACQKPVRDLDLVTRVTVQEVGQFELKTMSADKMKSKFTRKYREVILRKRKGEDLTQYLKDEPKALPILPATPETAKSYLDKIKQQLNQ